MTRGPVEPVGWTHRALDRINELQPELLATFGFRPILMHRDQRSGNPRAVSHQEIEAWLRSRGVACRIRLEPGGLIAFDSAQLVEDLAEQQ